MTAERIRILAIDDVPANLRTLGAALEGEFELQIATSGPAGISLALKMPPDLILLDVMMPEVDGFETFKRLAALPTLKHIPVVFVTALTDADSEATGLSLGGGRLHHQADQRHHRPPPDTQSCGARATAATAGNSTRPTGLGSRQKEPVRTAHP